MKSPQYLPLKATVWIIVIIRSIVLKDHVIDDSGLIRCTVFGRFYNISLHLYYTTDEPKLQYFQ